jgi:hypothetical protein
MDPIVKHYNELLITSSKILIILQLIPIIMGIIKWRYLNKYLKIFWWFCLSYFFIEILVRSLVWLTTYHFDTVKPWVIKYKVSDFSFTKIIYYLNNFNLLGYFFYSVLKPNRIADVVKWLSIILVIASIVNYLFIEGYKVVGVFNPTADALFCFVLPCIFMWFLFTQDSKVQISKNPYFWINLRLIIPNLIALILHFIGNKIQSTDEILYLEIGLAQNVIWAIGLVFATMGFYYARYTKYLPQNTPSH